MPINGAIIEDGATVTKSGGTAKTFTSDGTRVTNGINVIDTSNTDFRTRAKITAVTKQPSLRPDGKTWNKGRNSLSIVLPFVDAAGFQQYPLLRIELESHPEMSAANLARALNYGAQALIDADFTNFWNTGSLA